jgi:hypothetical protein
LLHAGQLPKEIHLGAEHAQRLFETGPVFQTRDGGLAGEGGIGSTTTGGQFEDRFVAQGVAVVAILGAPPRIETAFLFSCTQH